MFLYLIKNFNKNLKKKNLKFLNEQFQESKTKR